MSLSDTTPNLQIITGSAAYRGKMNKYTEPVHVKLEKKDMKALKVRAEKERRKPGQLARMLIEDGLKK